MNPFTRNLKDPETGKVSGKEVGARLRSAFAVIVSVAVLGAGGTYVYNTASTAWVEYKTANDYEGAGGDPVQVEIPKGTSLSSISDILVEAGVVKTAKAFDQAVAKKGNPSIQAGKYKLKLQLPAATALDMLLDKKNIVHNTITLPEGQWLSTTISAISKKTKVSVKDLKKVLDKPDAKKLGLPSWFPKGKTAEGFVFPDTYDLPDKPSAQNVSVMMTTQFTKVADDLDLVSKAKKVSSDWGIKVKPYDLVIAASIIEREVNRDEDRAKVAGVIYNRIKAGKPLQMDSTISYVVHKSGVIATTTKDRKIKSPYNTYLNKGLPAGPISNPGKAALDAAANPEQSDYLYFVVVNPAAGETKFATDEAGHEANIAEYRAWCNQSNDNYKLCYGKDKP